MSDKQAYQTGTYTTVDGHAISYREVMGTAIVRFQRATGLNTVAAYVGDCVLAVDGKPMEDARTFVHADLHPWDAFQLLRAIRVLSYGPILEEFTLVCPGGDAHPAPVPFKPCVDLSALVAQAPDLAAQKRSHRDVGLGDVALRRDTLAAVDADNAGRGVDMQLLRRIESVDGKPFPGVGSLTGRQVRAVKRQINAYDGDAGLSITALCPTCGRAHEIGLLMHEEAMLDFFGLI